MNDGTTLCLYTLKLCKDLLCLHKCCVCLSLCARACVCESVLSFPRIAGR